MKATASTHTRAKKNTIAFQNFLRNAAAITLFAAPYIASMTPTEATATDWSFDFGGTTAGSYTSSSSSANNALVPSVISPSGGGISIIRATTLGTIVFGAGDTNLGSGGEIRLNANTSNSSQTNFVISNWTASNYYDVRFSTVLTGNQGAAQVSIGNGTSFDSPTSSITGSHAAAAVRFEFGASNAITTKWNPISGTTFGTTNGTMTTSGITSNGSSTAGTVLDLRIVGNNDTVAKNYVIGGSMYSVGSLTYDVWLGSTRIGAGISANPTTTNTTSGTSLVDSLAFGVYGITGANSGTTPATASSMKIDNLTYSNALASAGSLYWVGGSGALTSSSASFANTSGGTTGVAQSTTATYFFDTANAAITVNNTFTANFGMTFNANGITISPGTGTPLINLAGGNTLSNLFTVTNSGDTATISAALSGSTGLTKAGSGSLVLSGTNTYTGTTAISAGTIKAGNSAAFGTSTISMTSGAVLDLNGTSNIANALSISGSGISSGGALINSNATAVNYSGLVQLSADATIKASGGDITLSNSGAMNSSTTIRTLTVGGQYNTTINESISNLAVIKNDTGTLTLNGTNTTSYSSTAGIYAMVVNAGTIKFGTTQPIGSSGSNVFGTVQGYTGNAVSIKSGATIDVGGQQVAKIAFMELAGTGAASAGGALINSSATDAKMQGLFMLTDNTTISASNGGLKLDSGSNLANTLNTRGYTLTLSGTGTSTNNLINSEITGSGNIVKTGTGTWTLNPSASSAGMVFNYDGSLWSTSASASTSSNTNSFTGSVSINAGTLKMGAAGALGSSSGVTVAQGATLDIDGKVITTTNALTISGTGAAGAGGALVNNTTSTSTTSSQYSGSIILGADATISANGASTSGARAILLSGSTITGSGFTLTVDGANDTSISSIIGTGTGGITKNGAGRLTLSGANTYSGNVNVNTGTLRVGNASALGSGAVTVASNSTLDLYGNTSAANALTISGTGDAGRGGALINSSGTSVSYTGNVTLAGDTTISAVSGNITLTSGTITGSGFTLTATGNQITTINSIIGTGTGGVIKNGNDRLTLSAANTYTGTTLINTGSVRLGNAQGLGDNGAVTVASGATLDLYGNTVTKTNALTISGTGAMLTSSSTSPFGGAFVNSRTTAASYAGLLGLGAAATISASGANITLGNTGTITGNTFTLTVDGAYNTTINSVIGTGTGGLIKNGAGTLTLNGVNTYSGTTTINAGTIVTNSANIAGSITNDGTLEFNNTSAANYSGTITGSGIFTKSGAGNVTLNSAIAHTGATNITAGTLTLGSNNGKLTGTSAITVSKDATLKSTNTTDSVLQASAIVLNSGALVDLTAGSLKATSLTVSALVPSEVTTISYTIGKSFALTGGLTLNGNLSLDLTSALTGAGDYDVLTWTGAPTGVGAISFVDHSTADWTMTGLQTSGNYRIKVAASFVDGAHQTTGTITIPLNKTVGNVSGDTTVTAANTTTVGAISGGTVNLSGANNTVGAISGGTVNLNTAGSTVASLAAGGTLNVKANSTVTSLTGGNLSVDSGVNVTVNSTTAATSTAVLSGAGSLVKTGNEKLTLSGDSSSFTGAINVAAGTVEVSSVSALGSGTGTSAALSLGTASDATAAKFSYTGGAATLSKDITALSTSTSGNIVENASTTGALTLSGSLTKSGTVLTLAGGTGGINVTGVISGSLANSDLIVSTGGTVTLTSANTYTGPTFVEAGATLVAANASATGTGTVNVASTATLQVGTAANPLTLSTTSLALTNGAIIRVYIGSVNTTTISTTHTDATGATVYDQSSFAGTNYSSLTTTGLLDTSLLTTEGGGVTIELYSTAGDNAAVTGLNKTALYDLKFLQFGSISNNATVNNISSLFTIDYSHIRDASGDALFADSRIKAYLLMNGTSGSIMMTIPEPSTYGLGLGALALAAVAIRRRKQKKSVA